MKLSFEKIFDAFEESCFGERYSLSIYINRNNGEIFHVFDLDDDMNEENPEDLFENDIYFSLPDPSEFCNGRDLVFKFASAEVRDHANKIYDIFQSSGAFSRFKCLLEDIGKLEDWYTFEQNSQREDLREWCELNEIDFE